MARNKLLPEGCAGAKPLRGNNGDGAGATGNLRSTLKSINGPSFPLYLIWTRSYTIKSAKFPPMRIRDRR